MSALDRLEKVANIPIFNKLAPKFLKMASGLHFHESCLDSLRTENNPVEGSKMMMKAWLSGESSLPPTWQKLLEMFQSIGIGEIAQKIEEFFNIPPAISQSASLVCLHVHYKCLVGLCRLLNLFSLRCLKLTRRGGLR